MDQGSLSVLDTIDPKRLLSVIERAQSGDDTALPELRQFMADEPSLVRHLGGDLAVQVERTLLDALVGDDLLQREAVRHELDRLRVDLAGPEPTPVERLLIDRIVACSLYLHLAEMRAASARSVSDSHGEFLERQVDKAQKRLLSAVRTLAAIRRLALPVNLNLAIGLVGRGRPLSSTDCFPTG